MGLFSSLQAGVAALMHPVKSAVVAIAVLISGLLLMATLWVLPAQATGIYDMPPLAPDDSVWVLDQADIISRVNEGQLSREFSQLASETGNQVRFVTIHRLDYGETIETFTAKLFDKWFPTAEEQANQVLMVLDSVTNNVAIRTGDGVKTVLPDATATSVAQETVLVPLRQGDKYNQAFLDAGDRLATVLSGQPDPGPPVVESTIQAEGTFADAEETDQGSATVLVVGFLIAATIIPMATYYAYQFFQS
ncbi:MAG: TPM domain-containing protein [Synechococcales bacterium]|nr:TPM domain-containing protein [Synechococcales bacterium]